MSGMLDMETFPLWARRKTRRPILPRNHLMSGLKSTFAMLHSHFHEDDIPGPSQTREHHFRGLQRHFDIRYGPARTCLRLVLGRPCRIVYSSHTRPLLVYTRLSLFGWFSRESLKYIKVPFFPTVVGCFGNSSRSSLA